MSDGSAPRLFVTPSLKLTGGNLELIRLAREVANAGTPVRLVAMWRAVHEADTQGLPVSRPSHTLIAPRTIVTQFPKVIWRFRNLVRSLRATAVVFTHYVTFPLSWIIPRRQLWFFVQDTEWAFLEGRAKRAALKQMILATLRRGRVLSANAYLSDRLRNHAAQVSQDVPIWADARYLSETSQSRDFDIAVMLRRGAHKRADLTLDFLKAVQARCPDARLIAISPDDSYRASVPEHVRYIERPDLLAMRSLYERRKLFALMSEHEGFGLPPLEAMGAGCVPLCRDAGGVRSYMLGELAANIMPLRMSAEALAEQAVELLGDASRMSHLSVVAREAFRQGLAQGTSRAAAMHAAGF